MMNNDLNKKYKNLLMDISAIVKGKGKKKDTDSEQDMQAYVKILEDIKETLLEEKNNNSGLIRNEGEIDRIEKYDEELKDLRKEVLIQKEKDFEHREIYQNLIEEIRNLRKEIEKKIDNQEKKDLGNKSEDNNVYDEMGENSNSDKKNVGTEKTINQNYEIDSDKENFYTPDENIDTEKQEMGVKEGGSEKERILKETIDNLPPKIKSFVLKNIWSEKTRLIAINKGLDEKEAETLQTETFLILAGIEPITNFIENIKERLEIDEKKTKELAKDISEEVFSEIEDELLDLQNSFINKKDKEDKEEVKDDEENIGGIKTERPEIKTPHSSEEKNINSTKSYESTEKDMENAGRIEIENENTPNSEVRREDILRGIETPQKSKINIVEKRVDPYREPIE